MKLTLKAVKNEVGDVKTFIFEPEKPISWLPGQFIHYTLPHDSPDDRGVERWFTISSSPFEKDVQITTRIFDKRSTFKQHLLDLKPGEEIETDMPDGDFVFDNESKQYVFVAGGIGITPFRSIINQLHHDGKDFSIELLYANRDDQNIVFQKELEAIAEQHDDFNIRYFIGDDLITEATLAEYQTKLNDPYFYVSGPEPMVEAFQSTLGKLGVDDDHLQFDYFPGYEA